MPRQSINYENTFFYKIVCKNVNITDKYVGHTTNFSTRKRKHKLCSQCPNCEEYNRLVYTFIRENGGWDNFEMILIEKRKCEGQLDAKRVERQYIEELHATLNSSIPSRTRQEWVVDNREKLTQYKHSWWIDNVDRMKQMKKEIYIQNREEVLEKSKKHSQENMEKCKAWKNGKTKCECGFECTNANKARHLQSQRHLNGINH